MYELSAGHPHEPDGRRYSRSEWELFCEGYWQALVMALRVLPLAYRRWERRTMHDGTTREFPRRAAHGTPAPDAPDAAQPHTTALLVIVGAVAAVLTLEVIVLLAVLIYRGVQ